jgi:hypothetical protein
VRQLLRAFNYSPRFAVALLYEFIHRWNHDIDVRVLGLPSKYANFFDGWEIEQEVQITASWDELLEQPHSQWECTSDFAKTNEDMGICGELQQGDLEVEVTKIVDAFNDGSLDDDEEAEPIERFQELPASAAWVANKLGRKRGIKPVDTPTEEDFFRRQYTTYQSGPGNNEEADNFSCIQWGAFSNFWNQWVKDEDDGKRPRTDMTHKNAFQLMAHFQEFKKKGNVAATMLPVAEANTALRRELRGEGRTTDVQFPESSKLIRKVGDGRAGVEYHPAVEDPFWSTGGDVDVVEDVDAAEQLERVTVAPFAGNLPAGKSARDYQERQPAGPKKQQANKKKEPTKRRCRRCGMTNAFEKYSGHHQGAGFNKITRKWSQPNVVCTTPKAEILPGFPRDSKTRMDGAKREK